MVASHQLRRIRIEREQVLKLFLAIPKSTISYVNEQLVGENNVDDDDPGENINYTSITIK